MKRPDPLRPPTRRERWMFRMKHRWPESYVTARLDHCDAMERWIMATPMEEVMRSAREERLA